MATRQEFATKLKERGASVEQSQQAFSLYRERNGFFDDEKPESLAPSFNSRIEQTQKDDVYAANKLYLNNKLGGVSQNEYQQAKEIHTGVEGASDEQAYTMYQDVENTQGQAIDIVDVMNKWAGRGKYAEVGEVGDTLRAMTLSDKFTSGLVKKKRAIAEWTEEGLKEGGAKLFFEWADFWPSTYRGAKQLVGLEDFNVPVIDDIARVSKGLKLGQVERKDQFVQSLKESGHLGAAATQRSLDAVGETLVFLNEIKRLNLRYGGSSTTATGAKKVLSILGHAQKISLFKALTSEDVTMKERFGIWKISSLYMSTPAASGIFKSGAAVFGTDFLLNSAISAGKRDGYMDIWESDADQFDKVMATAELLGADVVFSAMTKSYSGKNAPAEIAEFRTVSEKIETEGVHPRSGIVGEAQAEADAAGRGYVNVDKAEAQTKADIVETQKQLTTEVARLQIEMKEAEKPADDKTDTTEATAKETAEKVTGEDPMADKEVEIAVKQATLEIIEQVKDMPVDRQVNEVQRRVEQLGEVTDAPKGTKVKTLINRINNVRQKKPVIEITQKTFLKEIEKATALAAKSGGERIGVALKTMTEFAEKAFDYKTADKISKRLTDLSTKGLSPQRFAEKAADIITKEFAPKKQIDRTTGIKDLSDRVDISEGELLRSVLKAQEKAATGARKATVEKIVESQKVADEIINEMPKETRDKMISKLRKIATAKTDATREKYLNEFKEFSETVLEGYDKKLATAEYKDARKGATKLVKSGKVSPVIEKQLTGILESVRTGSISKDLRETLEEASSYDAVEISNQVREMMEYAALKTPAEMTAGELRQQADLLNGLTHQMKRLSDEIYENGKTRAQADVAVQENIIADIKPKAEPESVSGKVGQKIYDEVHSKNFDMVMIPRGIGESLDYLKDGTFTKIQNRLETSLVDQETVIRDVSRILQPHDDYMSEKGYGKNKDEKSYTLKDAEGKPLKEKLGVSDRLRYYLATKDAGTLSESIKNGWKRKVGEKTFFIDKEAGKEILKSMSQREIDVGDAFVFAYKTLGGYMDERSLSLNGYAMSMPDYAGPRFRIGTEFLNKQGDLNFNIDLEKGQGFNEQFRKMTVESSGRFKKRTGSKAPVLMYNPSKVIRGAERVVALYYGRGEALRDANRFLYESRKGGDNSLKEQYARNGKLETYETFEDYIADLNGARGTAKENQAVKFVKNVANAGVEYTAGVLKYNPKVALVQNASLPTAATVMTKPESDAMYKAFANPSLRPNMDEMGERSAFLWGRYHGKIGIMLGEKALSEKKDRGFGMIRKNDARVISSIWAAKEQAVRKANPELDGVELDRAIEQQVLDVVMKTQPSFDDVSRPELARSDNPIAKMVMIFSSQRNKNYYLAWKTTAEIIGKKKDGTLSRKDISKARGVVGNLAAANAIYAAITTAGQQLAEEILDMRGSRKMKDENEIADWTIDFAKNYATGGLSSLGAFSSLISSGLSGFDLDRTPISTAVNDAKKFAQIDNDFVEMLEGFKDGNADEVFKENWQKYGNHIATWGNLIAQPTTGVNIKNAYKYLIEAPLAVGTSGKRRGEREEAAKPKRGGVL